MPPSSNSNEGGLDRLLLHKNIMSLIPISYIILQMKNNVAVTLSMYKKFTFNLHLRLQTQKGSWQGHKNKYASK